MKKHAPTALLMVAVALLTGCQSASYRSRRVLLDANEPSWIVRGDGEFLTDDGKHFVAVGRAWETPDYDARREAALRDARTELRGQLKAYIRELSETLAARSQEELGASPEESREFFEQVGARLIEERVESLRASREWESMIRHEVYVMVELPTGLLLDDFRKGVLAGMATAEEGIFRGFIQETLESLEKELDRAVARSPMGDLAA